MIRSFINKIKTSIIDGTKSFWGDVNSLFFFFGALYFSVTLVLFGVFSLNPVFFRRGMPIDPELAAQYGGFIGGLFSAIIGIASTFFLIATFLTQILTNRKSQIETAIYKLIDYHRENVDKICLVSKNGSIVVGYLAFDIMVKRYEKIFELVRNSGFIPSLPAQLDITYKLFYYGFDSTVDELLETQIGYYFDDNKLKVFINKIRFNISDIVHRGQEYSITQSVEHQIGHYFRNLYNTVRTIDVDKSLSQIEKKFYMKLVRTQLSTPEIWILLVNSQSKLGESWIENNLINKYELIKNIPYKYSNQINHESLFPNIEYEYKRN